MDSPEKTSQRIRGTSSPLEVAARKLRQRLTPAEQLLWGALQGRRLNGLRFRCQHPVGRFVLDFYCPAYKLAVEVDGEVHADQIEQDEARTRHLEAYGYRVLRFRNTEVLTNLDAVPECIARAALGTPPYPPNTGGNVASGLCRCGKRQRPHDVPDRGNG